MAKVLVSDAQCSKVEFALDGKTVPATINLPGGYNIYNAATAMAVAQALELDPKRAAQSLGAFSCGFGRMERFDIRGASLRMILIKNPAGCNQVLNFLTDTAEPFVFVACLNDRAQDGKDVSWIWDVDFERLGGHGAAGEDRGLRRPGPTIWPCALSTPECPPTRSRSSGTTASWSSP